MLLQSLTYRQRLRYATRWGFHPRNGCSFSLRFRSWGTFRVILFVFIRIWSLKGSKVNWSQIHICMFHWETSIDLLNRLIVCRPCDEFSPRFVGHPRHHRLRHVTMAMDHNFLDRIGLASKVMIKSEKVIMQKWHLNSKGLCQLLGIHPVRTFGRGGTLNFLDPFILLDHNLRHTKPVRKISIAITWCSSHGPIPTYYQRLLQV